MVGLRPVIEFMTWNFALLAIDQIVNSAAKMRYMSGGQVADPDRLPRPGRRRAPARRAALAGVRGAGTPTSRGSRSSCPATPADAKGLLKSAIRDDNPVVFIEGEMLYNTEGRGARGRVRRAARRGGREARGHGRHARRPLEDGDGSRSRPRSSSAKDGDQRRGGRPAHHPAARRRDDRRVGREDQPLRRASRRAGRSPASAPRWWTTSSARRSTSSTRRSCA